MKQNLTKSLTTVFMIAYVQLSCIAKDLRAKHYCSQSGEVIPWLIVVIDLQQQDFLTWLFTYDHPTPNDITTTIYKALIKGKVPTQIQLNFSLDLVTEQVRRVTKILSTELVSLASDVSAVGERAMPPLQILSQHFWSTVDGYFGSEEWRDQKPQAKYTLTELDKKFTDFIENKYQRLNHCSTQEFSSESQNQDTTRRADPRLLDLLLSEVYERHVRCEGIRFIGQFYWHPNLTSLIGKRVVIRSYQCYFFPPQIEVFLGRKWICTATANTQKGLPPTDNMFNSLTE